MFEMKSSAIMLSLFLLFSAVRSVDANILNDIKAKSAGNGSSVHVEINNSVNTNSKNKSGSSSKTDTKVDISQEGEGTSSVKINGKEWKLEGPGEIHVNNDDTASTTPAATDEPKASPSPTDVESPTPTPDEGQQKNAGNIFEMLRETLRKIFTNLKFF